MYILSYTIIYHYTYIVMYSYLRSIPVYPATTTCTPNERVGDNTLYRSRVTSRARWSAIVEVCIMNDRRPLLGRSNSGETRNHHQVYVCDVTYRYLCIHRYTRVYLHRLLYVLYLYIYIYIYRYHRYYIIHIPYRKHRPRWSRDNIQMAIFH